MQTRVMDFGNDEPVFYDSEARELRGNQADKAKRFVALGLMRRTGEDSFLVSPLPGNKTTHLVKKEGGVWNCSCQFNAVNGRTCSHVLAAILFLRRTGETNP